jgi:hypothetical protein
MTDLATARERYEIATKIDQDYQGALAGKGGLRLAAIGDLLIVDDEADHWLCRACDYECAREEIVSDILDGGYDTEMASDRDDPLLAVDNRAYEMLCSKSDCLYSCIGQPNDITILDNFSLGDDDLAKVLDALGWDVDEYRNELSRVKNGCQ